LVMLVRTMQLEAFKLERYFARYEFSTRYLLCSSDCESMTIKELLSMEPSASVALERQWLGYTEPKGSPTLREGITELYNTIESDDVLVHSGAEEAIFLFMHAALLPGDHIIVHSPCYQSLEEVARSIGCDVTRWQARKEDGWSLDVEELPGLMRSRTRAVVINTPHNPTGFLMSKDDFQEVCGITADRGVILFSDEVYRESEHDVRDRLPAACDMNEIAVSLGVMSKTYGLPGLRIGWIATHNDEIISRMERLKDYTTICNGAPSENLAELALRHRQRLVERNLGIIRGNLDTLNQFFSRHRDRFEWSPPRAGPIAYPRLVDGEIDAFCDDLVTRSGVLLLPGSVYGDRENHFRIGFGRKNMSEALVHLEEYLRP
jgi:aspartate/methionine/tyrosine aminotransferase